MPFYCGKRSAGICVVLSPKQSSTYSIGKERVLARLGRAGVVGTPPVFSSLRSRICQHLFFLATKDDSDRLQGAVSFDGLVRRAPSLQRFGLPKGIKISDL